MRNYTLMADLVGILSRAGIEAVAPEPDADTPSTRRSARRRCATSV
jgi:hypothetical protein